MQLEFKESQAWPDLTGHSSAITGLAFSREDVVPGVRLQRQYRQIVEPEMAGRNFAMSGMLMAFFILRHLPTPQWPLPSLRNKSVPWKFSESELWFSIVPRTVACHSAVSRIFPRRAMHA